MTDCFDLIYFIFRLVTLPYVNEYGLRRSSRFRSNWICFNLLYPMVNHPVRFSFFVIFYCCCCRRFLLIYLKWSYQIEIKYSSIGLFDIENLSIQHQFFHLHIKHLHVLFSFSIFVWRLPLITINDSLLKINSIPKSTSYKNKPKKNWRNKLFFLKVRNSLPIKFDDRNISFSIFPFELIV